MAAITDMSDIASRPRNILLLVVLLATFAVVMSVRSAEAAQDPPDLHVHAHDEALPQDFADEGATMTFGAFVHNDGHKPARNFSIKISVPSVFPASIVSVSVSEAPETTQITCVALSNIAWKCDVDFLAQDSRDIGLEITLRSADIQPGFADGSVLVKTLGPANDDPAGQPSKHKFHFRVVDLG